MRSRALMVTLQWFKARIRDGSLKPPHDTIYWHLRVQWSCVEIHAQRVGAEIVSDRQVTIRTIMRSNGRPMPIYGRECDIFFPRTVEDALLDYALKVRLTRPLDGAKG